MVKVTAFHRFHIFMLRQSTWCAYYHHETQAFVTKLHATILPKCTEGEQLIFNYSFYFETSTIDECLNPCVTRIMPGPSLVNIIPFLLLYTQLSNLSWIPNISKGFALLWERTHQEDSNDTPQPNVSFKSASLYCSLRRILVYAHPQ